MEAARNCRPDDFDCIADDLLSRWERIDRASPPPAEDSSGGCLLCMVRDEEV